MRILLLADLHFRETWYHWLAAQRADLTVIAGDMLDGFRTGGLLPQMLGFSSWCAKFPGTLVLSGGNHDGNGPDGAFDPEGLAELPENRRQAVLPLLQANHWMDCLERPGVVTDGRTSHITSPGGAVIVTTIPYNHWLHERSGLNALWVEGRRLRQIARAPWIVLHHEPRQIQLLGARWATRSFSIKSKNTVRILLSRDIFMTSHTGAHLQIKLARHGASIRGIPCPAGH